MADRGEPLVDISFTGEAVSWRGPAPFVFVAVPEQYVGEIRFAARNASYGWGCAQIAGEANGVAFTTSLLPRGETYMVPLKVAVRKGAGIEIGDMIAVEMRIAMR